MNEDVDQTQATDDSGMHNDVKCEVLFDEKDNWLGVRILNEQLDEDGKFYVKMNLSKVPESYKQISPGVVIETEDYLEIKFDATVPAHRIIEQNCHIDCLDDEFGIEVILGEPIKGKELVKPFILHDI